MEREVDTEQEMIVECREGNDQGNQAGEQCALGSEKPSMFNLGLQGREELAKQKVRKKVVLGSGTTCANAGG